MHTLTQMHIEAARNSTDDFNLFHDKFRFDTIPNNPFGGPIALGFQLGCYIETQIDTARALNGEQDIINAKQLLYSGYEFTFAGIVNPANEINLRLKPGRLKESTEQITMSNRIMLLSNGKPVIIGYKKEYNFMPELLALDFPSKASIQDLPDRSFSKNGEFFIKHKYMIVGNAKNFLCSAFAEQSLYIDEFENKVSFPQMYPLSLISSALLERAKVDKFDLRNNPMIYVSHKLAIDKQQLAQLKSNDKLNIIVSKQVVSQPAVSKPVANEQIQDECLHSGKDSGKDDGGGNNKGKPKDSSGHEPRECIQYCMAYANSEKPLYTAAVKLMPLSEILD